MTTSPLVVRNRMRAALVVAAMVALVLPIGASITKASAQVASGYTFVPLDKPLRVLDTRAGIGGVFGPMTANSTIEVPIITRPGIPDNATGVAMNVTAVPLDVAGEPDAYTFVTVYPAGGAVPETSTLNVFGRSPIPNFTTIAIGERGSVAAYNKAGKVHLVMDVAGYYVGGVGGGVGARYFSLPAPQRLLDTRASSPMGPGAALGLTVAGQAGMPANAVAVALNVTVTGPSAAGYLTVYPWGVSPPTASNLNFVSGQTVPNFAVAKIGASGAVGFFNAPTGSTNLVVDVVGYYSATAPSDVVGTCLVTVTPKRVLDSRPGSTHVGPATTIPPSAYIEVGLPGISFPSDGTATAVMNVTATNLQPLSGSFSQSFVTVYPAGTVRPLASNLNIQTPQPGVPNLAYARLGAGDKVAFYNGSTNGNIDIVSDVTGYFSAAGCGYIANSPSASSSASSSLSSLQSYFNQFSNSVSSASSSSVSQSSSSSRSSSASSLINT